MTIKINFWDLQPATEDSCHYLCPLMDKFSSFLLKDTESAVGQHASIPAADKKSSLTPDRIINSSAGEITFFYRLMEK